VDALGGVTPNFRVVTSSGMTAVVPALEASATLAVRLTAPLLASVG